MHARSKALIEYAERCGFELKGLDGNGHYTLVHPNGETVRVASSPGDYRGDRNCEAEMRRKSGATPPRPRAGRHKKGLPVSIHTPSSVRVDSLSARVSALERRHRDLCNRVSEMQRFGRTEGAGAVVAELLEVEAEFAELGQRVPLRTFRTH